jgi:argininosuccinate lyase
MPENNKKLLKGRLNQPISELAEAFNASVSFDQRLALYDIQGSQAHLQMLMEQNIISQEEHAIIKQGLENIQKEIENGNFEWQQHLEDVHMNIEAKLIENIGEVGGKLHTARSRNDQVATDLRLYVREHTTYLLQHIRQCQHNLLDLAEQYHSTIMPGFTHLQIAQPVTFGHHLLAWFHMLQRDYERLSDNQKRTNKSPLGSAALAGSTYNINPQRTAELLGFDGICGNSLDAVSDRDFAIELLNNLSLMMNHLSRICEELILWNSDAFSLVDLPDEFCTGSSIMPQKKNPDIFELIRGKSARVFAASNSLIMLMKSQPLAYNKDNQEDKEPIFDSLDTCLDSLRLFAQILPNLKPKKENMQTMAAKGYSTATDVADYIVKKGIPFRKAYEIVGEIVRLAIEKEKQLHQLTLPQLQSIHSLIEEDIYQHITLEGCVNARKHLGGTAPEQVKKSVQKLRQTIST